jgi:hypothetical protein
MISPLLSLIRHGHALQVIPFEHANLGWQSKPTHATLVSCFLCSTYDPGTRQTLWQFL